jgi:hypothetical protein
MRIFYFVFATIALNSVINLLPFGRNTIQGLRIVVIAVGIGCAYRFGAMH